MKIYCDRADLNKALSNVSHSVPSKTTSPILEGILVEIKDNKLNLTSTDTNITISSFIAADNSEACEFVVPAKLFTAIINKLPDEEMMLDYDDNKRKLCIRCAGSTSEIICFSSAEYPKIKLPEGENVIYLSKEDVKKLIKKTAFSASNDDFNGILTGVLLEIKDRKMKMVGVDPYRIATYQIDVESDASMSIVIPAKLITEASKIISDEGDDALSLEITSNKVIMKFDSNKVIINTFSGKYIDYERILSKEGDIRVRANRRDLMKSTDRASLLTSAQNNNLIKFSIEGDNIIIKSLNEEGNIEEKVEIIKEGEDLNIGLNSKYMKDVLGVIDDEDIMMIYKDSISPCIIKPVKGDKYKYLVLPIRMN